MHAQGLKKEHHTHHTDHTDHTHLHACASSPRSASPTPRHTLPLQDALAGWLGALPDRGAGVRGGAVFNVVRSFDTNHPGDATRSLKGGVLGGALLEGSLRRGDAIELRPGRVTRDEKGKVVSFSPIVTKIVKIMSGKTDLPSVMPGGLIALETDIDPALTRADGLTGMVAGKPGSLPPVFKRICLDITWLTARQLGHKGAGDASDSDSDSDSDSESDSDTPNEEDEKAAAGSGGGGEKGTPKLAPKDRLQLSVGSAITTGRVKRCSNRQGKVEIVLDSVVACRLGDRIAVEVKKEGKGWSLAGFGIVREGVECDLDGGAQVSEEGEGDGVGAGAGAGSPVPPSTTTAATEDADDPTEPPAPTPDHDALDFGEGGDDDWRRRFTALLEEKSRALLDHTRLKVPPPVLVRDGGARALWMNFGATCLALRRPPSHLAAFIRAEGGLGEVSLAGLDDISEAGTGSCGDLAMGKLQLRLHTRARALMDKVCKLLRKYCVEFVSCKQCRSAQTTLTRNDDKDIRRRATADMVLTCRECGASTFARRI